MDTLTLKTEDLIVALRSRAVQHRCAADNHRTDPDMAAFYAVKAQECDREATAIEARMLLEAVQADPFMQAMNQPGVTELRLGRADVADNGLKPAPKSIVRAQWPHRELRFEAPTQPILRRGIPW